MINKLIFSLVFCAFSSVTFAMENCSIRETEQLLEENDGAISKDLDINCIHELANSGDIRLQFLAGRYHEDTSFKIGNYSQAAIWYEKAARGGSGDAAFSLALLYLKGLGMEKNNGKYIYWLEIAAERGKVTAQYNLGIIFSKGEGRDKNSKKAQYWFSRAAQQGDIDAQLALGLELIESYESQEDKKAALFWLKVAASNGSDDAKELLKNVIKEVPNYL